MATVPRLTPGVENRPTPFVPQSASGATLDNFGGQGARAAIQAGRDLSEAGGVLAKIAVEQQQEDNEREAKRLDVAFSEQLRLLTHGDGTEANPGLYGQRGENALSAAPATQKQIAELRRKMLGTTQNARVQELFGDISARRQEQEFGSIARFVTREREVANDTASEARLNSAVADAAAAFADETVIARSTAVLNGEISSMARRKGWAPEVTTFQLQSATTKMVSGMIQSAIRQDPLQAEAIYNKYKPTLLGTARAGIEQMLEQQTMAARSQQASDKILAETNNETAALAAAKEITHARLRDETTARIVAEYNRRQSAEAAQRARIAFGQSQQDRAERKRDEAAEKSAVAVVDNVIATTNGWGARYEALKELPQALRLAAEKRMKTEQARLESVTNSDVSTAAYAIVDKARETHPNDLEAQYKLIDAEADGRLRRAATGFLNETYRRQERLEKEEREQVTTDLFKAVAAGNYHEFVRNNPELIAKLAGTPILDNARKAEIDRVNGERYALVSEEGLVAKIQQMPPIELSRLDIGGLQYRLSQKDYEVVSRLIAGGKGRMEALDSNRSDYSRVGPILEAMSSELFKGKASEAKDQRRATIRAELDARISEYRAQNGKPVPDDTLRQWAAQVLVQVSGDSSPWNPFAGGFNVRAGEIGRLTPEQRKVFTVDLTKIDPAVRQQFEAALARTGPVSDARLQQLIRATTIMSATKVPLEERKRAREEVEKLTQPAKGQ
jgi:hypothetical protein